ncbi:MAG TPA: response regulator [Candidatus Paceibacterota bacterium]|nr:response regulator [Candidatus Paceibacterota bacterium]
MKILVLDDSEANRKAAAILLKGHDVTIVETYGEEVCRLLNKGNIDAYLGDLMLPASKETLAPDAYKFVGQEMPLGTITAFFALKKGVKRVAVLTQTNHHNHPASAATDYLTWGGVFAVGDALVLFGQDQFQTWIDPLAGTEVSYEFLESEEGKKKYPPAEKWLDFHGLLRVKNWRRALDELMEGVKTKK